MAESNKKDEVDFKKKENNLGQETSKNSGNPEKKEGTKETALGKKAETSVAVKPTTALSKSAPKKNFGKSVYGEKKKAFKKKRSYDKNQQQDEFEQKIVDLARVTRVMAGGKRMRFRACVAIGNKKGKIGIGLAKGADVTIAVTKAVSQAKKSLIEVPIINETIPHEIYQKTGAGKILFKPARRGKGVIAGGAVRLIMELAGVSNITSKILGSNNKVTIARCTLEAMSNLKRIEKKEVKTKVKKEVLKSEVKEPTAKKETPGIKESTKK